MATLAAGKAVLCVQQLAMDRGQAREPVRAAESSPRPTGCCVDDRWAAPSATGASQGQKVPCGYDDRMSEDFCQTVPAAAKCAATWSGVGSWRRGVRFIPRW